MATKTEIAREKALGKVRDAEIRLKSAKDKQRRWRNETLESPNYPEKTRADLLFFTAKKALGKARRELAKIERAEK